MVNQKDKDKLEKTIRRHFGVVLQQEGSYIFGVGPFVTVTKVFVTPRYKSGQNLSKCF